MRKPTNLLLMMALLVGTSGKNPDLEKRADELHAKILTLDSHNDTPMHFGLPGFDIRRENAKVCVDLPKMEAGGLDGAFFAAYIRQGERTPAGNEAAKKKALMLFENVHKMVDANPDKLLFATTQSDAQAAKKAGKRAIFMGVENGYAIGTDINMLNTYYDQGARYITLVHGRNNDICDSATDKVVEHNGLSPFGREVVKRMNELGLMVDISHASEKSALDAMEMSAVPVLASHSCARALSNTPRNMSDDLLRALAKNGGVMQLCILSSYVKPEVPNLQYDSAMRVLNDQYARLGTLTPEQQKTKADQAAQVRKRYSQNLATIAEAVDHIDHVVRLIGIDYVGIGTDFDGGGQLADCRTAADLKRITIELLRRGYTDAQIEQIWSGNLLRVMNAVRDYAQTQATTAKK